MGVKIDIWCGDNRVERLYMEVRDRVPTLSRSSVAKREEGDEFEAEVRCDDYTLEVVEVN